MSALGNLIGSRRREKGMSLADVAKLSGVTKSHIWDIEMGHAKAQNPSFNTVFRIVHAFGDAPKEYLNAAYNDWQNIILPFKQVVLSKQPTESPTQ